MRRPYFKQSRQTWYCEIDRKQINLGRDREQAFAKYEQIMRERSLPAVVTLENLYWSVCVQQA